MEFKDVDIHIAVPKKAVKRFIGAFLCFVVVGGAFFILRPPKWQQAVTTMVKRVAIDPSSVRIDFLCYTKGFVGSPTLYEKMPAVCALVNAKNGLGGYAGKKLTAFALTPDGGQAEFVMKEVSATVMCERICQYQAWSSRNAGEELARYSDQ